MDAVRRLVAPCEPAVLFSYVDDLDRYPSWMDLIHDVERVDDQPTWDVELRAQVGPFARSKKLRMTRTDLVRDRLAVFERDEADGRRHSPWVLRVELAPASDGDHARSGPATNLTMTLTYGGNLWTGAVLQRVLDDKVAAGSAALVALVEADNASR